MSNGNDNGNGIEPHDRTKNANGSMNMLGLIRMLVLVLLVTIVALIILFILFGVINISTIRSVDQSTRNTDSQLQQMIAHEFEDEKERERLVKMFLNMIGNNTENQKTNTENIALNAERIQLILDFLVNKTVLVAPDLNTTILVATPEVNATVDAINYTMPTCIGCNYGNYSHR